MFFTSATSAGSSILLKYPPMRSVAAMCLPAGARYTTRSPAIPTVRTGRNSLPVPLRVWRPCRVLITRRWMHSILLAPTPPAARTSSLRSEEHTSELQSRRDLVCRLLLEKKKKSQFKLAELEKKHANAQH